MTVGPSTDRSGAPPPAGARFFGSRALIPDVVIRLALAALGAAELLWPRRIVDFWMDLAAAGGEAVELRPWVYTAARLEGVLLLLWVLVRSRGD